MEKNKYSLKQNEKYGFYQIHPTPTSEEISKFYADEFYASDYKKLNDSSIEVQNLDKEYYDSRWADMTVNIDRLLDLKGDFRGINLLDIGCGWGGALSYFKKKGMECYGFDPAPEAIEYAKSKGLNCVVAGMDKMDVFFGKKFNVVTLINVFEHLADPVKVIQEIKEKVLAPNGLLIIDVPNEFNLFQVAGKEIHKLEEWWVAPPAHLSYFSGTSLAALLEGEGFVIRNMEASFPLEMFLLFGDNYVGNPQLGREIHLKRVNFELNLRKLGKDEELREFYRGLAKMNLGRQVIAYAKPV